MTKSGKTNVSDSARRLHSFVSRLENLDEQKAAVAEDIKVVKQEAKAEGFDMKVLNEVLRRRKQRKNKGDSFVEDFDATLAVYETSLEQVLS